MAKGLIASPGHMPHVLLSPPQSFSLRGWSLHAYYLAQCLPHSRQAFTRDLNSTGRMAGFQMLVK